MTTIPTLERQAQLRESFATAVLVYDAKYKRVRRDQVVDISFNNRKEDVRGQLVAAIVGLKNGTFCRDTPRRAGTRGGELLRPVGRRGRVRLA